MNDQCPNQEQFSYINVVLSPTSMEASRLLEQNIDADEFYYWTIFQEPVRCGDQ